MSETKTYQLTSSSGSVLLEREITLTSFLCRSTSDEIGVERECFEYLKLDQLIVPSELRSTPWRHCAFSFCSLYGASFEGMNLHYISFRTCDLRYANFKGTDLHYCGFYNCNLSGIELEGAKLNWDSHELLAEVLRRHLYCAPSAAYDTCLNLVARIRMDKNSCWDDFLPMAMEAPLVSKWAAEAFLPYVFDEEGKAHDGVSIHLRDAYRDMGICDSYFRRAAQEKVE